MEGAALGAALQGIGAAADIESMALPEVPTDRQAGAIRRAIVVLALWESAHLVDEAVWRAAADGLILDSPEREALTLYERATGRFSFFDRRAANWLFGHVVAAICERSGDFAYVAPAAAWAIHALNATDAECRSLAKAAM